MANEEVLGPRKTMFVLVIVVGCFAVLWPRILSPLILGHTREQLKPNQFDREAALKQERPSMRVGPHPALRERGRAITPTAQKPSAPVTMPPHARPPPIPGMRPPLGSPGGPVPAPKSSMGFVMPIYTICIIVFFVYTLSKILFKRTGSTPYEPVTPDPQFRRRVFRDDSRTSPDKLVVTAISGLVAEVRQQMETSYAQNQQRQDLQDNNARPYTNGTVLHNTGPVHIVASEYREASKEKSPEPAKDEPTPAPEPKESAPELKESTPEKESVPEPKEPSPELDETSPEREESPELDESMPELKDSTPEPKEATPESEEPIPDEKETSPETKEDQIDNADLIKLTEIDHAEEIADEIVKSTEDFLDNAREVEVVSAEEFEESPKEDRTTPELLEEALKEDSPEKEDDADEEQEKPSVKVVGMEITAHAVDGGEYRAPPASPAPAAPAPRAHEAEEVKSIFLETQIPQQSRVLVAEFEDDARAPASHSSMVVSGKMTLSLIQDAPRDTPDRDLESTVDDFTTASAVTQPAEKEDELSDEEIEEEIEIEEIEEEVEEEEEEEEPQKAQQKPAEAKKAQK